MLQDSDVTTATMTAVLADSVSHVQLAAALLVAAAACLAYYFRRTRAQRSLPIPPGPDVAWYKPGDKYVHSFSVKGHWCSRPSQRRVPIKLAELTETYGPVVSFRRGSQLFVVINRYQVSTSHDLQYLCNNYIFEHSPLWRYCRSTAQRL